jgi:hypothetical protein
MTKEEKAKKRQQMLKDLEDGTRHAQQRARADDYMAASMYTAQALKAAQYLADKAAIAKLKPQLIEFNKKAVYQEFDYSVELPKDEINALINRYVNEPAGEISLFKLAYSKLFVPDSDEIAKSAQETLPITTQIVTQHVVDNEGNTVSIDDAENHWRWERYGDNQQFRTRLLGVILAPASY